MNATAEIFLVDFTVWPNDAAAIGNWIYGFNGTNQSNATLVLGELSAIGECESGIFEEFAAHTQPIDSSKHK